jgi:hypothetical protein
MWKNKSRYDKTRESGIFRIDIDAVMDKIKVKKYEGMFGVHIYL